MFDATSTVGLGLDFLRAGDALDRLAGVDGESRSRPDAPGGEVAGAAAD